MGMATVKLMNDSTLQNDTITRDGIQERCGSFEITSTNGQSIGDLCGKKSEVAIFLS